ncbi:aspartate/glutamate racemase family protein [Cognatilysobacter tabacisoli]|jgi:aspartate racemase|uniref:aspartate/glutamate racemase family protein n=1 Tax=Cognatilysobacter tabacisoli TaxID=2315424 RepID=UPI000E6B3805|nr:aspartate/glutamate racemase family protein [Lysobacter tabacisoli]
MKTLGLIGGMSWESTIPYYRVINETVKQALGGLHSAKLLLASIDFAELEALQRAGDWDAAGRLMADAAGALRAGGADAVVICANTMHIVVDAVEAAAQLPVLHIADATADAVRAQGLDTVGLLGTRFTMEQPFLRERLESHGLRVRVPDADARALVHRVIYDELCRGEIRDASRDGYRAVMAALVDDGAQGVILGCTEIGLLVGDADASVPLFDTAALHARYAARWALDAA